jgi:type II secretory pathway pseudopilin PulG
VWRAFRNDDSGFSLIEVLVSAVLVITLSATVLSAVRGSSKTSGAQRARSQATALAQAAQEGVRGLSPATLASYVTTPPANTTATMAGITFTTSTTAAWVDETTGGATCAGAANLTRYVRLSTTTTWPGASGTSTYTNRSLVGVPSGGGRLVAQVFNFNKDPQPGVTVDISGPSSANAVTSAAGCVEWDYLTPGTYTVTVSHSGSWVDRDGKSGPTQTATVIDGKLNTVSFDYESAAVPTVRFYTQFNAVLLPWCSSTPCPKIYAPAGSGMDQLTVQNTGQSANRIFGTAGTLAPQLTTSGDGSPPSPGLFPFATTYSIYPGLCLPTGSGIPAGLNWSGVLAPGSSPTLDIRLPEFDVNTKYKTSKNGATTNASGARIVLDRQGGASGNGCPAVRLPDRFTNSNGDMPFAGVPSGYYNACAEFTYNSVMYHADPSGVVDVRDFNAPASYAFTIGAFSGSGSSPQGPCP